MSAEGVLSLLEENDYEIKELALTRLLKKNMIQNHWAEISQHITKIEDLYNDDSFLNKELAAFVASKVYYHLGALKDSLDFALHAGKLFNINEKSEYVDTILSICIDKYIEVKQKKQSQKNLEDVVEKLFQKCLRDEEYKQVIGIAIESRRFDILEETLKKSGSGKNQKEILSYCLDVAMNLVIRRDLRQKILRILISIYRAMESPDYFSVTQCLLFLKDHETVAKMLHVLMRKNKEISLVTAYQIAFDLFDKATQSFTKQLINLLQATPKETDKKESYEKLFLILSGKKTIPLHVDFLYRRNKTDILILNNIKDSFERSSIYHSATVTANAFMYAGTTIDSFLGDNIEWFKKASNWAKFSATASLGVIHKGKINDSRTILKSYLPNESGPTPEGPATYTEGGSLFALGIIHSNYGDNVTDYLLKYVKQENANEVVQHGACLGLGLAAMGSGNKKLCGDLKKILFLDKAVSSESAAVAMGLIMLGSHEAQAKKETEEESDVEEDDIDDESSDDDDEPVVEDMIAYAHETVHEKIIRGLAVGISLSQYGLEEVADDMIKKLISDKDPIMRYGGMYTIGLAYCGTANNGAIKKLLHFAVSDVSDDVRRAAVINLGFLLFKKPKQCPVLVSLLTESYNPHVRYGSALAVGISCAGTGLKEAIELLLPLTKDRVDFVRQGALISLAMITIQKTEKEQPLTPKIRILLKEGWTGRHEVMAKKGAILAQGIIDAGGRNVTIALHKNGNNNMRSIIGMALFTQYWFWYPYLHFLSMSFVPTGIIGLTKDLKIPKWSFRSNVKSSLFAYPKSVKPPEKKRVTLAPTAQLSTSKKEQAKEKQKLKQKTNEDEMDVEEKKEEPKEEPKEEETENKEEEKEPDFQILNNPCRVTPGQMKYISFNVKDTKYIPLKKEMGIIVLVNTKSDEKEEFVEMNDLEVREEEEPKPPADFQFP